MEFLKRELKKEAKISNTIGEVLDLIYTNEEEGKKKLLFKNKETGEIYNLAYHYVVSEIMYLYVYKDS